MFVFPGVFFAVDGFHECQASAFSCRGAAESNEAVEGPAAEADVVEVHYIAGYAAVY